MRPPMLWNLTRPSHLAKRVSSLPLPTLRPGCIRVPRWRMMMLPAVTVLPAGDLTPSRRPSESLPFRELLDDFLCAI